MYKAAMYNDKAFRCIKQQIKVLHSLQANINGGGGEETNSHSLGAIPGSFPLYIACPLNVILFAYS